MTKTDLTATQIKVLNIIRDNNKISRKEIAKLLKISPSAVQKHLENLKLRMLALSLHTRGNIFKFAS